MNNLTLRQQTKQLDLVIQKQQRCNEFIVKCNMELEELVQAHKGRSGRYNNNYTERKRCIDNMIVLKNIDNIPHRKRTAAVALSTSQRGKRSAADNNKKKKALYQKYLQLSQQNINNIVVNVENKLYWNIHHLDKQVENKCAKHSICNLLVPYKKINDNVQNRN